MWSESGATFANVPVRTCSALTKWGWSAWRGVLWFSGGWVVVHRAGLRSSPRGHWRSSWPVAVSLCGPTLSLFFTFGPGLGWGGFGSLSLAVPVHISAAPEMAAHTPAARIVSRWDGLRPSFLKKSAHSSTSTAQQTPKIRGTVVTVTVWMEGLERSYWKSSSALCWPSSG
eukprot:3939271-Rhodomonas_salina.5